MELKACKNCRYFAEHFACYNGSFYSLLCGHCINKNVGFKQSDKRDKNSLPCNLWQSIEIQKAERRENIKESLRTMAQRLDEIARILKNDE